MFTEQEFERLNEANRLVVVAVSEARGYLGTLSENPESSISPTQRSAIRNIIDASERRNELLLKIAIDSNNRFVTRPAFEEWKQRVLDYYCLGIDDPIKALVSAQEFFEDEGLLRKDFKEWAENPNGYVDDLLAQVRWEVTNPTL